MKFTVKFNSRKEHDDYCLAVAKKLQVKQEKKERVINAIDILNKPSKTNWTQEDEDFIKENYGKLPVKAIADTLNRDKASIIRKASELRRNGHNIYKYESRLTQAHEEWLKNKYER